MSNQKPLVTTDIGNYTDTGYADPHETMKALTWQGKNQVKVGKYLLSSGHLVLMKNDLLRLPCLKWRPESQQSLMMKTLS